MGHIIWIALVFAAGAYAEYRFPVAAKTINFVKTNRVTSRFFKS